MIEIRVDDREVTRRLRKLYRKTGNLSPAMRVIAGIMADAAEENFDSEGRPAWEDLADSTVIQRERLGYWPGKTLQRTGKLAASISTAYDQKSARIGTNKIYAAIQQLGGDAGRGHKVYIPPRPYLELTEDDRKQILDEVETFLVKA